MATPRSIPTRGAVPAAPPPSILRGITRQADLYRLFANLDIAALHRQALPEMLAWDRMPGADVIADEIKRRRKSHGFPMSSLDGCPYALSANIEGVPEIPSDEVLNPDWIRSARKGDILHGYIQNALIALGWTLTLDPFDPDEAIRAAQQEEGVASVEVWANRFTVGEPRITLIETAMGRGRCDAIMTLWQKADLSIVMRRRDTVFQPDWREAVVCLEIKTANDKDVPGPQDPDEGEAYPYWPDKLLGYAKQLRRYLWAFDLPWGIILVITRQTGRYAVYLVERDDHQVARELRDLVPDAALVRAGKPGRTKPSRKNCTFCAIHPQCPDPNKYGSRKTFARPERRVR